MVKTPSAQAPRSVTILGSTGSVGGNTVDLLLRMPERFRVEALTAHRNVDLLAQQARALRPRFVAIADPACYRPLTEALAGTGIEVAAGAEAVVAAAERPAEWVMAAIVGSCGLAPTMAAVRRGAMVAFANKECLVCAGPVMIEQVRSCGATLLPVDSEHNAIFQVLEDEAGTEAVERLVLTASGGPFRTLERSAMETATPEQAVAHPTWSMGAKISVDSATMMNKGLEIIEAHYLFGIEESRISVLVHPQSVVHSMVAYVDGSVLAQLGTPDMRTPIAHCLAWPGRMPTPSGRLDLARIGQLTFEPPDEARFPALALARQALQAGGSAPAVLNAANEIAVAAFLARRIGFLDIERTVDATLTALPAATLETLDDISDIDQQARETATRLIAERI